MAIVGKIAGFALTLAVGIGLIGKLCPELFLKVPGGFILWAITGNVMPPYFDASPYVPSEFATWIQDGDLIVSAGAKSGTNWMLYCAHQIRTKAQGDTSTDFTDVLLNTPWAGLVQTPGQTWAERKEMMNTTVLPDGTRVKEYWDNPNYPFRIFKSHWGPSVLPITKFRKVKFLAMSRNGMDVVASFYPFFAHHRPDFKAMWGGFPPTYANIEAAMADLLPGGTLNHLYFGYIKDWWPMRKEPNVLILHYSDAKRDLAGTVSALADFVGVKLNAAEHAEVTRRCGIEHMKSVSHKFDYVLWAGSGKTIMCGKSHCKEQGLLIQSGRNGKGMEQFSEEMRSQWPVSLSLPTPRGSPDDRSELGNFEARYDWFMRVSF